MVRFFAALPVMMSSCGCGRGTQHRQVNNNRLAVRPELLVFFPLQLGVV